MLVLGYFMCVNVRSSRLGSEKIQRDLELLLNGALTQPGAYIELDPHNHSQHLNCPRFEKLNLTKGRY